MTEPVSLKPVMDNNERAYIALCKQQIESRFAFGQCGNYSQRDLEALAERITEKTGVVLSLSTLKRLWKGGFKQRPQPATLNALAVLLDYRDWTDFKLHNRLDTVPAPNSAHNGRSWKVRYWRVGWVIATIIPLSVAAWFYFRHDAEEPGINGPVTFTARKTVAKGTPATVVFDYDVSRVAADSFFIQQSWNPAHRVPIDPQGGVHTTIYQDAGYHRARLMAGDSVIAMQPVHILTSGWEARLYYSLDDRQPIAFANDDITGSGMLHLNRELLQRKHIDFTRPFMTRISYSQPFGVHSDNFTLSSRLRLDSTATTGTCPAMQVTVVTERHIFWVNLQQQGCERHASYKLGEVIRDGANNDLSALGVDGYAWQELNFEVNDREAKITLGGHTLCRETFEEDFGDIMGLLYIFSGTGSLDHVKLAGSDGNIVFDDDFR